MISLNFVEFLGKIDIQYPTYEVPSDSPIFIGFRQKENLTKREMLKRFRNLLSQNNINYLQPYKTVTNEWIIDLKEIKYSLPCFENIGYLKGSIIVEPSYHQETKYNEENDEEIVTASRISFSIYPEDIDITATHVTFLPNNELLDFIFKFKKDYPDLQKCGFLMMKFEDTSLQNKVVNDIKSIFSNHGFTLLRADDKWYSDDLLKNIQTYMHCCAFGVALFERVNSEYFNPNVSLEVGYMMGLGKPILFLKEKTLRSLHSDLIGKLYHEFDIQNEKPELNLLVEKWLRDKEIL